MQRESRRVALTPAGQAFLAGARSALVLAHNAAAAARRTQSDRPVFRLGVDIDMPGSLVRQIRRFGSQPADTELRVTIAQQDDVLAALNAGELDAVIGWTGPPTDATLTSAVLVDVAIHGVVRDSDPLARSATLPCQDLIDHALSIYLPNEVTRPFYDYLLDPLAVDERVPRISHVHVLDDAQEAMLDAVEQSGGFTICVEDHLDALDRPTLVALPFDPPVHTDVVAMWHGAETPSLITGLHAWLSATGSARDATQAVAM